MTPNVISDQALGVGVGVDLRDDHRPAGEAVEPGVGGHEHTVAGLVAKISEDDVARLDHPMSSSA